MISDSNHPSGFPIIEYLDVEATYKQLKILVSQPVRPVKRDEMAKYLERFEAKYATSKPIIDEAKKYIPGGVQHNLAFIYPFPVVLQKKTFIEAKFLGGAKSINPVEAYLMHQFYLKKYSANSTKNK